MRPAAVLLLFSTPGLLHAEDAAELFVSRIQPALKQHCFGCHGESQTEAKLDLRTRESMLRGGGRGPAILPGDAARSPLYLSLRADGLPAMPPGDEQKRLAAEVVEWVRRWIDAGAPFSNPRSPEAPWSANAEHRWAFQPLRRPDAGKSLDRYIEEKLRARGLTPAPRADRLTLIRRATFDLTGLPPTPEEVDAFLADPAPDAFARLLERLLASPRYGERWGRHWLDVVRYADTDGYSNDFERPNAWRYRDYVIRSFNQDKPYDRFILEQIAGDELDSSNAESLVATGFLRMGPWEQTGMSVAAVTRQQWLDDVTHHTANVFLGLTMGCARCHDHKFDPIPTRDYYSLQAVFASTVFAQRQAPFQAGENRRHFDRESARIQALIRWNQERLKELDEKVAQPGGRRREPSYDDLERERIYRKRLEIYRRQLDRYKPLALGVGPGEATPTHILVAGNLRTPGAKVVPAVVHAAFQFHDRGDTTLPETVSGRRSALARWIAGPDNPLTARVMVNRIWQRHFGRGLAANTSNLGKMGGKPTHPELLDYLADYFIRHGWSVKAIDRLIMSSAAYQRASGRAEADPDHALLAYFPPRRLAAEELRDSILAVAGELNAEMSGPGVFPEINEDVAAQPRLIMGTLSPLWQPSPERAQRNRRSIYTYQKRGIPDPMMEIFNQPGSGESCERRDTAVVPMQVYALFHGRFARDMALAFAANLEKLSPNPGALIETAFRRALQRPPSAAEKRRLLAYFEAMRAHHEREAPPPKSAREPLVRSLVGEYTGKRFDFREEVDPDRYEEYLHPSEVSARTRALADVALVLFNTNEFLYVY